MHEFVAEAALRISCSSNNLCQCGGIRQWLSRVDAREGTFMKIRFPSAMGSRYALASLILSKLVGPGIKLSKK